MPRIPNSGPISFSDIQANINRIPNKDFPNNFSLGFYRSLPVLNNLTDTVERLNGNKISFSGFRNRSFEPKIPYVAPLLDLSTTADKTVNHYTNTGKVSFNLNFKTSSNIPTPKYRPAYSSIEQIVEWEYSGNGGTTWTSVTDQHPTLGTIFSVANRTKKLVTNLNDSYDIEIQSVLTIAQEAFATTLLNGYLFRGHAYIRHYAPQDDGLKPDGSGEYYDFDDLGPDILVASSDEQGPTNTLVLTTADLEHPTYDVGSLTANLDEVVVTQYYLKDGLTPDPDFNTESDTIKITATDAFLTPKSIPGRPLLNSTIDYYYDITSPITGTTVNFIVPSLAGTVSTLNLQDDGGPIYKLTSTDRLLQAYGYSNAAESGAEVSFRAEYSFDYDLPAETISGSFSTDTITIPIEVVEIIREPLAPRAKNVAVDALRYPNVTTVDLTDKFTDPDELVTGPTITGVQGNDIGDLSFAGNVVSYTPKQSIKGGLISAAYTVTDEDGLTEAATILFNVKNRPPTAVNDTYILPYWAAGTEQPEYELDVLANDSDADGDDLILLQALVDASELVGSVRWENNKFYYKVGTYNYAYSTSFSYEITDGIVDTVVKGSVTINVQKYNRPPVLGSDIVEIPENVSSVDFNPLINDSDPDFDEATSSFDTVSIVSVEGSTTGVNGTLAIIDADTGLVRYTIGAGDAEGDSGVFTYTAADQQGAESTGEITVNIIAPINNPPVADDITDLEVFQTNSLTIFRTNDAISDPDGDDVIFSGVTLAEGGGTVDIRKYGTYFVYLPGEYVGDTVITYTVSDRRGGTASANAYITVYELDSAPVTVEGTIDVSFNGSGTINPITENLVTDSDDDDSLEIISVSLPDASKNKIVVTLENNLITIDHTGADSGSVSYKLNYTVRSTTPLGTEVDVTGTITAKIGAKPDTRARFVGLTPLTANVTTIEEGQTIEFRLNTRYAEGQEINYNYNLPKGMFLQFPRTLKTNQEPPNFYYGSGTAKITKSGTDSGEKMTWILRTQETTAANGGTFTLTVEPADLTKWITNTTAKSRNFTVTDKAQIIDWKYDKASYDEGSTVKISVSGTNVVTDPAYSIAVSGDAVVSSPAVSGTVPMSGNTGSLDIQLGTSGNYNGGKLTVTIAGIEKSVTVKDTTPPPSVTPKSVYGGNYYTGSGVTAKIGKGTYIKTFTFSPDGYFSGGGALIENFPPSDRWIEEAGDTSGWTVVATPGSIALSGDKLASSSIKHVGNGKHEWTVVLNNDILSGSGGAAVMQPGTWKATHTSGATATGDFTGLSWLFVTSITGEQDDTNNSTDVDVNTTDNTTSTSTGGTGVITDETRDQDGDGFSDTTGEPVGETSTSTTNADNTEQTSTSTAIDESDKNTESVTIRTGRGSTGR